MGYNLKGTTGLAWDVNNNGIVNNVDVCCTGF